MLPEIKEKISSFFSQTRFSERMALFSSIGVFFLFLILFLLLITFILPKTRVEIKISGPEKAKAGEWVTYTLNCKNTGNVILENPELTFQHPSASLPEKSLIEVEKLGEFLYPKEEKVLEFKSQIFGQEGEKQEIKAWLNFSKKQRPERKISKIATFSTTISEVPIDLVLDIAPKIPIIPERESEFNFRLRYTSFIDPSVSNLKFKVDFPQDFNLKEAKPEPTKEKIWEIPILSKGETREIEFWGFFPKRKAIGEKLDSKVQLFINLHGKDFFLKEISAHSLTFQPTFLFSQKINGHEDYILSPGEKLHYQVYFKNIRDEPLREKDLSTLTIFLEGNLFDLFTIEAPSGEFTPGDNTISWSKEKIPQLRYLAPGEEGQVEFLVRLKSDYKPKDISETNALIKDRILLAGFEKEFRNKVNSKLKISQEGYYQDKYRFFENSGPHPPRVNETTTYTIVWKIENYYNWIRNIKVKAALPQGVRMKSFFSPQGEMRIERETFAGKSGYPDIPENFRFENPLYQGITSEEVRYLQIILKSEVPACYPKNVPASGYFGRITFKAVKCFQKKYKDEILVPQKLKEPIGFVDELTRAKLNELLIKTRPLGPTEVVWEIEKIEPGRGALTEPLIAAFQIAFTPDFSQKGRVGKLIEAVTLNANDQWTGTALLAGDEAIDTTLPDDPGSGLEGKIR